MIVILLTVRHHVCDIMRRALLLVLLLCELWSVHFTWAQ